MDRRWVEAFEVVDIRVAALVDLTAEVPDVSSKSQMKSKRENKEVQEGDREKT